MSIRRSTTDMKYGNFRTIEKNSNGKIYKCKEEIKPDFCPSCQCEVFLKKGKHRLCTQCGVKW